MMQVISYKGGFADDIDIIGRSLRAVEEAFLALEGPARRMGLVLNEKKTKYMVTGRSTPITSQVTIQKCERVRFPGLPGYSAPAFIGKKKKQQLPTCILYTTLLFSISFSPSSICRVISVPFVFALFMAL
uniref:Reverse transcriptase domain-containing protein n=1 Tax=Rhodnius prolixus TaxID=13249 RepID=T1HZ99_RHOPR